MGKTVCAINQLIHSALNCEKPNPRFAYIAPTYNQSKRIAWDYLLEYTRALGGKATFTILFKTWSNILLSTVFSSRICNPFSAKMFEYGLTIVNCILPF